MIYPGDRITINAVIKDKGVKVDPSAHEIKIYSSDGTLQDTYTNPSKDAVGEYHLDYDIPDSAARGTWVAFWSVTIGSGKKTEPITFDVVRFKS